MPARRTGPPSTGRPIRPPPRRRTWGCLARAAFLALAATLAGAIALVTAVVVAQGAGGLGFAPIEALAEDYGLAWVLAPTRTSTALPVQAVAQAASDLPPSATPFQPRPPTATPTATDTPTTTPSATPTETSTDTPTATETGTETASPSASDTASAVVYPTFTSTRTRTRTPTVPATRTRTATAAPSRTRTPFPSTVTPGASGTSSVETATATPDGAPPASTATAISPTSTAPSACASTGNSDFENTLLGLINQERQDQGLAAYAAQGQLQAAARIHSADMACNGFVSHTGSDGSGVRDRVARQGYSWSWIGENIYCTGDTSSGAPQQVFHWWMNSAPHRANLMSPNYTQIGLGYIYAGNRGCFTAVFARPG